MVRSRGGLFLIFRIVAAILVWTAWRIRPAAGASHQRRPPQVYPRSLCGGDRPIPASKPNQQAA